MTPGMMPAMKLREDADKALLCRRAEQRNQRA